jgi:hypothetical protein
VKQCVAEWAQCTVCISVTQHTTVGLRHCAETVNEWEQCNSKCN